MAVGSRPNTDLARSSNLELDEEHGGFLVNAELMARTDIWSVSVTVLCRVWQITECCYAVFGSTG